MTATAEVKELAYSLGFDLVGVCPATEAQSLNAYRQWLAAGFAGRMNYLHEHTHAKESPECLLPGVRSIIAVGLNYNRKIDHRPGYPRIARYALGRDYHKVLRSKLRRVATVLDGLERGSKHRICVDSAPLLEREYAHRAGLGWFGKNTLLINSARGSWFVLGFILTTIEFEPDQPAQGGCGTCRACIDACPTGAIVQLEGRWAVDARQCISYLTIEAPQEADHRVGDWTFGCDICQEVCPFNQSRPTQGLRAQVTSEPDFLRPNSLAGVRLRRVQDLSEVEWDELTRGSPVRRSGREGLAKVAELNQRHGDSDSGASQPRAS